MTLIEQLMKRPFWAADDEGAGGDGGAGDGGAGDGGAGDGGAGDGGAGDGGAGDGGGEKGKGTGNAWWEADTITAQQRDYLTKHGLTKENAAEIVPQLIDWHTNAEKKLGKPADSLITRPEKDQKLSDWAHKNREMFGLPEKAEDYAIERPELPTGMEYDEALEGKMKAIAFEEGVPPAAMSRVVAAYAEEMARVYTGATDDLEAAKGQMRSELEKEWGDQTDAKLTLARQAMNAISEAAGFDQAAILHITEMLKPGTGDAGIMRMAAAIGEMMGEDQLKGIGSGNKAIGTTPAEARQQLDRMKQPDHEYGKAVQEGNQAVQKRFKAERERLFKIASSG